MKAPTEGPGMYLARDFAAFIKTGEKVTGRTSLAVGESGIYDRDQYYHYGVYCARVWMTLPSNEIVPVLLVNRSYSGNTDFFWRMNVLRAVVDDLGCQPLVGAKEVYHDRAWFRVYTAPKDED